MKTRLVGWIFAVVYLLAAYGGWLYVRERAKVAELTMAVLLVPREEVVVSGYVRNVGASAFSLERLLIEEPGKEPYPRQVALDADRKFELALGKPAEGTYRASVWTRSAGLMGGTQEGWLRLPDLVVNAARREQQVRVRDFDDRSVAGYAVAVAAVGIALCVFVFRRGGAPSPLAPG